MCEFTAGSLSRLVGGQLQLADMPPLGGASEPVGDCVLDLASVQPGDVYVMSRRRPSGLGRL